MMWSIAVQIVTLSLAAGAAQGEFLTGIGDLARLMPGRTRAENALWIENGLSQRFNSSKQVVVAEVKGPAVITMIHFAMPQTLTLNRDVLLKAYWDGETSPSVDCPLVDFFCDPAGLREAVDTAMVNKRRGFNAYFPMPFRTSAKIELNVPKGAGGTLRLYMIDPDNFEGGRKQTVTVAGKPLGVVGNFQEGRWLERAVSPGESADGKILIQARNMQQGSNAVLSIIEWIAAK